MSEDELERNFLDTIKSPVTQKDYIGYIKKFKGYLKVTDYSSLLNDDYFVMENNVIEFLLHLKKKGLSYSSRSSAYNAICHFYTMNDVDLRWRKIRRFLGEEESIVEDRPYTKDEIALLLNNTSDKRTRITILLCSSAGLRIGALSKIKKRHLVPMDKHNVYQIIAYKNSKQQYYTFCTPECRKEIDDYFVLREKSGEKITDDSPLFRSEINTRFPFLTRKARCLSSGTLRRNIYNLTVKSHIIEKSTKNGRRNDVMNTHGFRKHFKTTLARYGLDNTVSEMLMGHVDKLTKAYLKRPPMEILEGNENVKGYIHCIDGLTISAENVLKEKVQRLTIERDEIKSLEENHKMEIKELEERMEKKVHELFSKIDLTKFK